MLTRVAVRVRADASERALAALLDLAPEGMEERDLGDAVEFAIYAAPGLLPRIDDLRAAVGDALVDVGTSEVAEDWQERWREFHRPAEIGARLHLRAPWHEPRTELTEIVIDPGQAFGTGSHPTTRLCLELLLELEPAGAAVDVGSGSGVLAIAAAKLGFAPVLAIDHEDASVRATRANALANGVALEARSHDLLVDGPSPTAPTVLANLLRPLLLRVAADGFAGVPPRALIASGLLAHEADEVAAAFAASHGLVERARRRDAEWAALLLVRGPERPGGVLESSP